MRLSITTAIDRRYGKACKIHSSKRAVFDNMGSGDTSIFFKMLPDKKRKIAFCKY